MRQLKQFHGSTFLSKFEGSLPKAIASVFSEHTFYPWLFRNTPMAPGYWKSKANRTQYIQWLVTKAEVPGPDSLQTKHFVESSGYRLLGLFNQSPKLLLESIKDDFDDGALHFDSDRSVISRRKSKDFWVPLPLVPLASLLHEFA